MQILETVNFENAFTQMITEFVFPESFFEEDPPNGSLENQFENPYFVANLSDVIPFFIFNLLIFSITGLASLWFHKAKTFKWWCDIPWLNPQWLA